MPHLSVLIERVGDASPSVAQDKALPQDCLRDYFSIRKGSML